jgi:predicted DNA-binding protein (MmcQ/YjbR family)
MGAKNAKEEKEAFARAKKICAALPGVFERISWGHPNWLVGGLGGGKGGKMFAGCGTGHGGPHLVFKVADRSLVDDDRYKPVSEVGKWPGYEDWYLYYFDWEREDDWDRLKHLMEVSWELMFSKLPKKKQAEVLGESAPAPAKPKRAAKRAKKSPKK